MLDHVGFTIALFIVRAASSSSDQGGFIIGLLGVLATIASGIFIFVNGRGGNKNTAFTAKTALDAQIDARVSAQLKEGWERIDALEKNVTDLTARSTKRDGAITRILRAIAKQWPNTEGPDLDPADIAEIEETIPAQWIRKSPRAKKE